TKKVFFMVQDNTGNFAVANDTIYLDRVAPDPVTITINDDDIYTNLEIVSLALFAEDTGSGLNHIAFSTDNVVWSDWESYGITKFFTLPTGDGPKTVYFKVEDMANNSATASDSITLDTEPPINLSIVINDNAQYTNSINVELDLTADDNTSGVYQMAFSTGGLNWDAWEAYNTSKAYTLPTGDGPKVVYFKVRDMVNNTAFAQDTIVLDTAAPAPISIVINDGDANTNSASVTLTLSASDSGSGISEMAFSANNVDWTTWEAFGTTKAFTLENVDGLQTAYLRVNDNAGNIATVSDTITLDTTPPHSLSITINDGDTETDEVDVSLALDALDATTSVHQMAFSTDNTTWTAWENFTATKAFTLSTGDGLKTIYFKVDDLVGNEALPVYATITLKTEPEVTDTDGDTYPDDQDAFPNDPNEWEDTDEDGTGDNADDDDDEDGYLDEWENFLGTEPKDAISVPPDHDDDGKPDGDANNSMPWMDIDDDDDGYTDAEEKSEGTDPLSDSDYPTDKKKKDDAEDYSLYLIILVIIIVIVILALAFSRRGKGEEEAEEALAEEEGEAEDEDEEEGEEEDEEDFECPTCGAPLKASDTVCTECGEEFEDEDEE
ncbi:MAG: zinc ribbon domain-containing protein, partial [Thermoplasmata archaeon]|nr:zinc ribbon domain-containing protein [Thermoplasmata archaeon]